MTFAEARAQFPVLERYAYLNAGTFGPLATPVAEAMRREQEHALEEGRVSPKLFERMLELRATVRGKLADVLAASPENVALTTSTTDACHVVVNRLDLGDRDEVVTTDAEHFGLIAPLAVAGVALRVARVRDRPAAEAFDRILAEVTPRTKLVALSHVSWITGHALPYRELREATGVPTLVDGAQSAGAIPVDMAGADFYTVSAQKWLCGPDLSGALYVADPDALRFPLPRYVTEQTYDLGLSPFAAQAGAARFDTSFTPMATLAGLEAALDLHPTWALARGAEVAARCAELVAERVEVVTEPGQSTLVSFRPKGEPRETVGELVERGVIVRDLPGTGLVRASCGWWTSDDDLQRLVEAL